MKIKVITSYKPGNWQIYGKKGIESMAENLPSTIDLVVYAEEAIPDCNYSRITWLDLNTVEPKLNEFKFGYFLKISGAWSSANTSVSTYNT